MTYNFLLAMAAQRLMPETGPDLLDLDPPRAPAPPRVVVDPPHDPAPQLSATRFGVEQAGRSPRPDEDHED